MVHQVSVRGSDLGDGELATGQMQNTHLHDREESRAGGACSRESEA